MKLVVVAFIWGVQRYLGGMPCSYRMGNKAPPLPNPLLHGMEERESAVGEFGGSVRMCIRIFGGELNLGRKEHTLARST